MSFYEKYLKYKTKYLNLKAQIGGVDEACPMVNKEDKFFKEMQMNTNVSKQFDMLSYAYACTIKRNLSNLKSNQDKLLAEMKTKLSNKTKIGGEYDIYFEVLEAKYKESKDKIYGKLATDLYDYMRKQPNVHINKNLLEKVAPTLIKTFRGIVQKQLGSMWIDK